MKVNILEWNAVATWKYNFEKGYNTCAICQNEFERPSTECKTPGEHCIPGKTIILTNFSQRKVRTHLPSPLHSKVV